MRALLVVVACLAFVGCTFGANTCTKPADCTGGSVCDLTGFCVTPSDSGAGGGAAGAGGGGGVTGGGGATGGGGSTGGGGGVTTGGGGGTGGGQSTPFCADAGLACAEWQECVPSTDGGTCEDSEYQLAWLAPDAGTLTRATNLTGQISVEKRDGGVLLISTVPVLAGPGTTATVSGMASPFTVSIGLGTANGTQSFVAGWQDGGPIRQLDVEVDRAGPIFLIGALVDAGYGLPTTDFLPVDSDAPGAYRKDEVLAVRVTTTSNDVATVKLVARYGTEQRHEVTSSTNCTAGGGRCDDFVLDLSLVSMTSFRGTVRLTVEGTDLLGNVGTEQTPTDLSVTRWQWARKLGGVGVGSLRSTPAIGSGGRVFVGISNGTGNGVIALQPTGSVAWGPIGGGPVEGPLAVGRGTSGEWLFFNPNSGAANSLSAANGTGGQSCGAGTSGAANTGGVALLAENTANVGSISLQPGAVGNRGRYNEAQPGNCNSSVLDTLVGVLAPGNMVIGGASAYFVNSDGDLRRLGVGPGSAPSVGTLTQSVGGVGVVNGLALLTGTRVVGGGGGPGIGRLFAFEVTQGAPDIASNAWPTPTVLSSPTSGPSIGAAGVFAQYRVSGRSNLLRVNSSTGVVLAQSTALGGAVQSSFTANGAPTPALGAGNKAYVVDEKGSLFVVPQDFAMSADAAWAVGLPASLSAAGVVVTASPNLDCNRRIPGSQTGVLYIATETGWLVSYLVDSRGLDPSAPWPKYARDPRNTGSYSASSVVCP